MKGKIPSVIKTLYYYFVTEPNPKFWPDYLQSDPVRGHGLWAFCQGLRPSVTLAQPKEMGFGSGLQSL